MARLGVRHAPVTTDRGFARSGGAPWAARDSGSFLRNPEGGTRPSQGPRRPSSCDLQALPRVGRPWARWHGRCYARDEPRLIHHSIPVTAVTQLPTRLDHEIQEILRLAHEVHRLLGGGWSEAIYCDALLFLCEEHQITCRRATGVRGVGPVRAAVVCGDTTLVRVCSRLGGEPGLRRGLAAIGLEQAVLLRFDEDAVASQVVPVHGLGSLTATGDPRGPFERRQ